MSSNDEPTWGICRKAVWMLIQDSKHFDHVNDLLNRQERHDLHIASGKCITKLLTAISTLEQSRLECALAEFKRLEARCNAKTTGGWLGAVKRKLFSSVATSVDDYDRQIILADVTMCIACLTMTAHWGDPSVGTLAQVIFTLRRAWKIYQQCYMALLDVYRNIFDLDLDQNTPKWPPVLKRRKSVNIIPSSNIGSRMLRSATTSFEMLRQNSFSNMMPQDVIRLMSAVSVGYGAFNLVVSFLPSTIISVIGMMGFHGNRQIGLDSLTFAKNGPDVHAPLAWGILSWYRMVLNTDYLFDGPRSRENESCVNESEQLVVDPPEEFRNSTLLQYFTGRSCYLKGDLDGSIRAYEIQSAVVEYCPVNMEAMCLHELGFMHSMRLDWTTACRVFTTAAENFVWMRPYHYFMASVCACAAGDVQTAKSMWRRADDSANDRWPAAERNMVGKFMVDGKLAVAKVLQTATDDECGRKVGRLIVYEAMYVKYGVARWPVDTLQAVLPDCRETVDDEDDATRRYTKRFLTIVCRRALGFVDGHCRSLMEIVQRMERDKRRDRPYAYGLFELAVEQIGRYETVEDGKITIQKLNGLKGPYHFQQLYELRCASLQASVQRLHVS